MNISMISFRQALPVWPQGEEKSLNQTLLFRQAVPVGPAVLRITGQSAYQVFINGVFVAYGPARACHGYHYVDEIDLTAHLRGGQNVLAVLAYAGGVDCYAYANGDAFLCAELEAEGRVIAATGRNGFLATRFTSRVRIVPRFSLQRAFTEAYEMDPSVCALFTTLPAAADALALSQQAGDRFLARAVPYPEYERALPAKIVQQGRCVLAPPITDRVWKKYEVFRVEDLETDTFMLGRCLELTPGTLPARDGYTLWDFGQELTGFAEIDVEVDEPSRLIVTFDEILSEGRLNFRRMTCLNCLTWNLQPGKYHLTSMEPNSWRYAASALLGVGRVTRFALCRYEFPAARLLPQPPMPEEYAPIYRAALQTFRQNAVDIFMDCPSRERAGWLCDSFFTGRAEFDLTGQCAVERAFLTNFILPDHFPDMPEGMLPMCYPSEHRDGGFIPNWAMWFVLELEEYLRRSGDRALVDAARDKVFALLDYFARFENEFGLLEKLERWVFVEWSHANDLVQDVSYPSNMLYKAMLEAVARLYDRPDCAAKAARVKDAIRAQALMGVFFCDNALRAADGLTLSGECTETNQYYAFFCGVASPETDPILYERLLTQFGPTRDAQTTYPEIAPSNAFIGDYLRLEMLLRNGRKEQVRREILAYFAPMAATTGTLWENNTSSASCNHGFASSIVYFLRRAMA